MKVAQTFSILIWANKSKTTKSGLPLFARVTVDGRRIEISLKRKVPEERWDATLGKLKGAKAQVQDLNNYIEEVKAELHKIYHHMVSSDRFVTAESIKQAFTGETEPRKTLLWLINYHNEDLNRNIDIGVSKATWTKYNTLHRKVKSFVKEHKKRSDYFLEELKHSFVTDFEYYLKGVQKIRGNTTMKYIRMLKKIINLAVRNGWLGTNPFQNFKCTFRWPDREVLSFDELVCIIEKDLQIERLRIVRDYFVFSCFTGLSYIDVVNLSFNDISTGIDGNKWLIKLRKKTDTAYRIPLLPQALTVLERYGGELSGNNSNLIFPRISNQKMNSYLKEIGDVCGIKKNLTFHLARHTFATTVTLTNGVPIESVSKMLGHTKIATTQIYAKVVEEKLSNDMNLLREKLMNKNTKTIKSESNQ